MTDKNEKGTAEKVKQTPESRDFLLEELAIKTQEVRREKENLATMRKTLDNERNEQETGKRRLKLETEDFYTKRNAWEKDYKKKKESLELIERNLENVKRKIELERREIEIDLQKMENERRMLEEENEIFNSKRAMLEEERKTLDRERKLLNERENKFADMRKQLRMSPDSHISADSFHSRSETLGSEISDKMPEPARKVTPRPKKTASPRKKGKTMPCFNCGAEVVIPDGVDKVSCSVCNKEYTIRAAKPADEVKVHEPAKAAASSPGPSKQKVKMRELGDGRVEVICENTQCGNKFTVDDLSARRVHCPICGRRMRLH